MSVTMQAETTIPLSDVMTPVLLGDSNLDMHSVRPGVPALTPAPTKYPFDGPQLFAHYSFMPNHLGYCGGDDNKALFDYVIASVTDGGLVQLLKRFSGAIPYMRLIARSNGIRDPLDVRVVEAYWVGNQLLENVDARDLHDVVNKEWGKQINPNDLALVLGKAPAGAHPHHSFHVFEVCPRKGWPQALSYLDNCRVSWGQVTALDGALLQVNVQPLEIEGHNLVLGEPVTRQIKRQFDGRGFVDSVGIGDWVSIHWGWACQTLSERQRKNLEHWTRYHIRLANETL